MLVKGHGAQTIKRCFFLVLIVLIGMAVSSCERFNETVLYKEANQLYKNEDYKGAIDKYIELAKRPDFKKDALLHLGYCYLSLLRSSLTDEESQLYSAKAIEYFKEYLKLDPENKTVEDYIFNTYMDARDYDSVLQFLFDKFENDNTDIRALQLIIQTYEDLGKVQEAIEWYRKRIEITPDDPNAYYAFSVFYWRNSFYNQALDPALRAQFVDEGVELCKQAIEINPDFADAYTYWNLLLREKVKYTKNKREQEKLLEEAGVLSQKGTEIRLRLQQEQNPEQPSAESPSEQETPTLQESPVDAARLIFHDHNFFC